MKRILVAASLTAMVASLSACGGGGSSAPADASKEDFCGAYVSAFPAFAEAGDDTDKMVTAIKDWGKELSKVGTPEGISEDARKGFEVTVEQMEKIKASDFEGLAGGQMPEVKVSQDDQAAATAFSEYASTECAAALQEAITDISSGLTESTE